MKAICFGDSNTYGYDPCSWPGGRYGADSRWVDILAVETGWRVCNMGQNGRTIPETAPAFPADTDLLILMLGTNDLLQGSSPQEAAWKLERFLAGLPLAPSAPGLGRMGVRSTLHRRFPSLCPVLPRPGKKAGRPLCRRRRVGRAPGPGWGPFYPPRARSLCRWAAEGTALNSPAFLCPRLARDRSQGRFVAFPMKRPLKSARNPKGVVPFRREILYDPSSNPNGWIIERSILT